MKKLLFFLAACAISLSTLAASINANPVDFGEVSIKGLSEVEGEVDLVVTWNGLVDGSYIFASIETGNYFYVDGGDYISGEYRQYIGYGGSLKTSVTYTVHYLIDEAGTFSDRVYLRGCYDGNGNIIEKYVNVTIKVTDEYKPSKVIPFARINSTSELNAVVSAGTEVVFVSENLQAVSAPYDGSTAHMPVVFDNVTVNKTAGTALAPDTAQTFIVTIYDGKYQFTTADTHKRLHLDVVSNPNKQGYGKGTFTFADPVANQIFANWGVSFNSKGEANICHVDANEEESYPIEFNADRFKPYLSAAGGDDNAVTIYKKTGDAQEITAKLEIDPSTIAFGNMACSAEKELTINYTAEHLEKDITWQITGTDKAAFQVTVDPYNTRTSGSVKVKYLGSNKTGALSAALTYGTWDAKKDTMHADFPIGINVIKLDGISFTNSEYTMLRNQSIDFSQEVVFDPSNVADKGLTWSRVALDYGSATITDAGVFTPTTTGKFTVKATSVLGDNIYAECTVNVKYADPTGVTLDKTAITLHKGETYTLSATIVPDGTGKTVKFSSDNTTVASVHSTNGKITAKDFGSGSATANIKAYVDGVESVYAICVVTVEKWAVESLAFDPNTATINSGSSLQLEPVYTPAGAKDENPASYESSDTDVATVDENGKVTGIEAGTATITATAGGKTATITITVGAPKWFTKLTNASLNDKDTIILASESLNVIAGAFNSSAKKLTPLTTGITFDPGLAAYSDDAERLVVTNVTGGITLTIAGTTKKLSNPSSGDITANGNNSVWSLAKDGTNGVYVTNNGTSRYFSYNIQGAGLIRTYNNSASYKYLYVYRRAYKEPATGVENVETEKVAAQKILHEGRIVIVREGVMYEIDGRRVQ